MKFRQLYEIAHAISNKRVAAGHKPVVTFVELRDAVIAGVSWLKAVNVFPIRCQEGDPRGHFECHSDAETAYDTPDGWIALITYDAECNDCWGRMVWTKELMHVFDTDEGIVNRDNYRGFIFDIEIEPPNDDFSEAYLSENDAKWMALICLCPSTQRDKYKAMIDSGKITPYEVALAFMIPQAYVSAVMSENYDRALEIYLS